RPSRICSRVNSPSFAPSRATWINGMASFYGTARAKSIARGVSIEAALCRWLRRHVERAPEIPRRHGSIRPPFFADFLELFRRRQFSAAKSFRETFLHAVIGDRPDIEPPKIKEQQHLDRPPADAAHFRKALDNFLVAHLHHLAPRRDSSVERFRGEIF